MPLLRPAAGFGRFAATSNFAGQFLPAFPRPTSSFGTMKSGGSINVPDLPLVHASRSFMLVLLILCLCAAAYCCYRLMGGRGLGWAIRKKLRRRREKSDEGRTLL